MKRRTYRKGGRFGEGAALLMLLPFLLGVSVFLLYPFGEALYFSFFKGIDAPVFVGIENYRALLSSPALGRAVVNTFFFLLIAIPAVLFLPLATAYALRRNARTEAFFRRSISLAVVMPSASLMLVSELLFSHRGLFSKAVAVLVNRPELNLYETDFAFFLLILLYLFRYGGIHYLIAAYSLSRIPKEYEEEAAILGAGAWRRFFHITLPLLTPMLLVTALLALVNSYKIYREAYLVGGEYPHESIYLLQHFINNNFRNMNYNRLCALSVLLVTAILLAALFFAILYALRKRRVY